MRGWRQILSSLPGAEDIVQYDYAPETLLNDYPSKRKDNYDGKKKLTTDDESMLFERGLHQDVHNQSDRAIMPYYASLDRLSWR